MILGAGMSPFEKRGQHEVKEEVRPKRRQRQEVLHHTNPQVINWIPPRFIKSLKHLNPFQ